MTTRVLALLLLLLTGQVSASTMDCVANDGFDGEWQSAPPLWRASLAKQNCARKTVQPQAVPAIKPLSWDANLAADAQTWADGCHWQHSGNGHGENIAAAGYQTPPTDEPGDFVPGWINEAANYNYASNACSGVCGHYTQVVWRNTQRVGCGFKSCTANSPFGASFPYWVFVVCDYDPPGNFNGARPY